MEKKLRKYAGAESGCLCYCCLFRYKVRPQQWQYGNTATKQQYHNSAAALFCYVVPRGPVAMAETEGGAANRRISSAPLFCRPRWRMGVGGGPAGVFIFFRKRRCACRKGFFWASSVGHASVDADGRSTRRSTAEFSFSVPPVISAILHYKKGPPLSPSPLCHTDNCSCQMESAGSAKKTTEERKRRHTQTTHYVLSSTTIVLR